MLTAGQQLLLAASSGVAANPVATPAIVATVHAPAVATESAGVATQTSQAQPVTHPQPQSVFAQMMGSSSRGRGIWNLSKDALTQMKYTHFLVEWQLHGINLASQAPFGPTSTVAKQLKQKVKALFNVTVAAAANSDKQDLHDAAREMASIDPPPEH
jgi:hypothetical protein